MMWGGGGIIIQCNKVAHILEPNLAIVVILGVENKCKLTFIIFTVNKVWLATTSCFLIYTCIFVFLFEALVLGCAWKQHGGQSLFFICGPLYSFIEQICNKVWKKKNNNNTVEPHYKELRYTHTKPLLQQGNFAGPSSSYFFVYLAITRNLI